MKKILKIVLIILVLLIVLVISFKVYLSLQREQEISEFEEEISGWSNYYQKIARECKKRPGYECCMAGLRDMIENNYLLADENENCPEGFKANMNRCKDTLIWCEPAK